MVLPHYTHETLSSRPLRLALTQSSPAGRGANTWQQGTPLSCAKTVKIQHWLAVRSQEVLIKEEPEERPQQ